LNTSDDNIEAIVNNMIPLEGGNNRKALDDTITIETLVDNIITNRNNLKASHDNKTINSILLRVVILMSLFGFILFLVIESFLFTG
jgi:hypothetical protein